MNAVTAAISALRAGDVLAGRYRLERPLGEGGMGVVWQARQLTTDRAVALKFLKGDDAADRARFLREAKIAAGLSHRNVVQVFDFWEIEDGGPVFLVMELLVGETLAARIARQGALPLAEITSILIPVARALAAAHAEGLVHRDLKPENVFLARAGAHREVEIKVVDFGLARPISAQSQATSVTQTGAVMGTPHYMAPEQVFGEKDVDARADVWSFGVVLYECATGHKPFDGENFGQIFRRITREAPPLASLANPSIPPALDALILRTLVQERADRPTMDQLADRLMAGFEGRPSDSFGSHPPSSFHPAAMAFGQGHTLRLPSQPPERPGHDPNDPAVAATLTDVNLVRSNPQNAQTASQAPARSKRAVAIAAIGASVLAVAGAGFVFRDRLGPGSTSSTANATGASSASSASSASIGATPDAALATRANDVHLDAGPAAVAAGAQTEPVDAASPIDASAVSGPGRTKKTTPARPLGRRALLTDEENTRHAETAQRAFASRALLRHLPML